MIWAGDDQGFLPVQANAMPTGASVGAGVVLGDSAAGLGVACLTC